MRTCAPSSIRTRTRIRSRRPSPFGLNARGSAQATRPGGALSKTTGRVAVAPSDEVARSQTLPSRGRLSHATHQPSLPSPSVEIGAHDVPSVDNEKSTQLASGGAETLTLTTPPTIASAAGVTNTRSVAPSACPATASANAATKTGITAIRATAPAIRLPRKVLLLERHFKLSRKGRRRRRAEAGRLRYARPAIAAVGLRTDTTAVAMFVRAA